MTPTTKKVTFAFVIFIVAGILLLAAYTWMALSFSYSEGERAGYLQKFSKRGWICKTWEGELLLTALPGTIPEKFQFSVRDEAVAKQLSAAAGKHILVSYSQHKGVPTQCFGETEYYADKVVLSP
ncbi:MULTISPECIES: hypothetical protein [unclassified Janthinobacterium]|uniref:hypothetical protein n=1 Tax=unclassified Janthinobacterium TaxID=2610881 RepID=UPI00160CE1C3|nr:MULTISPECIES: hypothetical protein [unclassified Janthinobacterium]MBB5369415.1 hypothetical protein [Janthinobacterium sp. K2C7]MBB5381049.1 hypothetical protein [Janthinobacterium sp. K2Li3]MBB5387798.1 hypothetical protein [Janthinobacterium sp. K2E3]